MGNVNSESLLSTELECGTKLCFQVRLQSVSCPEEHSDRVMQEFENILRDEELRVVPGEHQDGFTPVRVKLSDGKDLAEVLSLRGHVVWNQPFTDRFDHEINSFSAEKTFSSGNSYRDHTATFNLLAHNLSNLKTRSLVYIRLLNINTGMIIPNC